MSVNTDFTYPVWMCHTKHKCAMVISKSQEYFRSYLISNHILFPITFPNFNCIVVPVHKCCGNDGKLQWQWSSSGSLEDFLDMNVLSGGRVALPDVFSPSVLLSHFLSMCLRSTISGSFWTRHYILTSCSTLSSSVTCWKRVTFIS